MLTYLFVPMHHGNHEKYMSSFASVDMLTFPQLVVPKHHGNFRNHMSIPSSADMLTCRHVTARKRCHDPLPTTWRHVNMSTLENDDVTLSPQHGDMSTRQR